MPGSSGSGEVSSGPQSVVCKLLEDAAPLLRGMDPLAIDAVWGKLFSITVPRPGGLGGWDGLPPPLPRHQRPQFMAAMAGIDIALWDIAGKAASKPVFRLLGGTRPDAAHLRRRRVLRRRAHLCSPAPRNWQVTSPMASAP
mgnify:CR=1 FL=1